MTNKVTITIEKTDGWWTVSAITGEGKVVLMATAAELWDAQQHIDTYLRLLSRQEEAEKEAERRLTRGYPCDAPYCGNPAQPTVAPPFVPTCNAECPPETPSEN